MILNEFILEEDYKSLHAGLTWNSISPFSVITGLNGVGKTHLLEAIQKNQEKRGVKVNFISDKWEPKNFDELRIKKISVETVDLFECARNLSSASNRLLESRNDEDKIDLAYNNFMDVLGFNKKDWDFEENEDLAELQWGSNITKKELENKFNSKSLQKIYNTVMRKALRNKEEFSLKEISETCEAFLGLSYDEVADSLYNMSYNENIESISQIDYLSDIFSMSLSAIDRTMKSSGIQDLEEVKKRSLEDLELDQFPWEKLNNLLARYHSNISICEPNVSKENIYDYKIKFRKNDLEKELEITDLSSGEKVIINAFLMSYLASMRTTTSLLLLDEPDASLNPALVHNFLDILKKELVAKNVQIIATTHSAVTANLLLDENLFIMSQEGSVSVIRQAMNKKEAVNLLTGNLLTVNDNFGVVLTESTNDTIFFQEIFEQLHKLGKISNHPPLKFHAASNKLAGKTNHKGGKSHSERDGGKSSVKMIVEKFREVGLDDFVLGIIDSDKTLDNPTGNSIQKDSGLVAPQQRHSIENYLCDPVILLFMVSHSGLNNKNYNQFRAVLEATSGTKDFFNLTDIQPSLNNFFTAVAQKLEIYKLYGQEKYGTNFSDPCLDQMLDDIKNKNFNTVTYENGITLEIPRSFLMTRGHDLSRVMLIAIQNQDKNKKLEKGSDLNNRELLSAFQKLSEFQSGFIPTDLTTSIITLQNHLNKGLDINFDNSLDISPSGKEISSNISIVLNSSTNSVIISYHGHKGSAEYNLYKGHSSVLNSLKERSLISIEKHKSEDDEIRSFIIKIREGEEGKIDNPKIFLTQIVENLGLNIPSTVPITLDTEHLATKSQGHTGCCVVS